VIGDILPPEVVAAEVFGDLTGVTLFPEEEMAITRAVDKRRREFTTARGCARAALARLGKAPVPIVPGTRGAPQWPPGVVGSITHCDGYRACAVARDSDVLAIGLDAEPHGPLPDGVLQAVSLDEERAQVVALTAAVPDICWDRILFCAKESVYKAWFPLTRRWLGFGEARVSFDPGSRSFTAELLADGPVVNGQALAGFTGRWLVSRGLIATSIVLPSRSGSDSASRSGMSATTTA
jgi:enterobactin synthetase component D / holo-[acyl-carrier protein] synthase